MITKLERDPQGSLLELDWDCELVHCTTREEWLAARRSVIGASDVAGVFGVGYADQSPLTVWDSKVNPREDDRAGDKRLKIGKLMEPSLRLILQEETGLECVSAGEFDIYRNRKFPYIGATLDGVVYHDEHGNCPAELKNVSGFLKKDWETEAPLKYQVQCQAQLLATGATHAILLGLLGGNEPIVHVIERNERFLEAMVQRLADFWGYVERRELPPVDDSLATGQLLSRLWPDDTGATVTLPPEADHWADDLAEAKEKIKTAEAVKTAAENKIKAALQDATIGLLPGGGQFSWKTQHRDGYTVQPTSFRVLRHKAS